MRARVWDRQPVVAEANKGGEARPEGETQDDDDDDNNVTLIINQILIEKEKEQG
ncbi:hypothetical protein FRC17_009564, partial [Serendipita sp. 399]